VEGVLKQDYVLVEDTRAVEFNRVADGTFGTVIQMIVTAFNHTITEIEAARRKPSISRKTTEKQTKYPPASPTPRTTAPPSFRQPSDGSGAENRPNGRIATNGAAEQNIYPPSSSPPPPFATAYRTGETPSKKDYAFPPAPQLTNNGTALATPLLIKPPASALARALNVASKKLFGSPTSFADQASSGSPGSITKRESDHYSSNPNSPRFVPTLLPDSDSGWGKTGGARPGSPAQDELLSQLETLAHKAHVLAEWADKKFDKVEASPSSTC
jgi:serine/threonine-protein kinase ULK/ATG1